MQDESVDEQSRQEGQHEEREDRQSEREAVVELELASGRMVVSDLCGL